MADIVITNQLPAAALDSPSRAWLSIPFVNTREVSSWAREKILGRARSLYANSSEVRHAVNTLAMMVGTLSPRPCSGDEQWDKEAREAFLSRVENPLLFDSAGQLSWTTAQAWLEKRAIIDGDCLSVLTHGLDGGGKVAFYQSTQIKGDDTTDTINPYGADDGVIRDSKGKIKGYKLYDYEQGTWQRIGAGRAVLYRHNPDPADARGHSELISAVNTAQDIYEILGYNKASIKFAALFGLVETQSDNSKAAGLSDLAALRRGKGNGQSTPAAPMLGARIGESQAITLSPGHKLETIHDSRPSNEVQAFLKSLVDSIAFSVGLDPVILYRSEDMGSASTRFVIAKAKDVIKTRVADKVQWCNKIYQYILSCEVAAGRLRPCPTDRWANVRWVNSSGWSIDLGRDARTSLDLISAGLMSADDYCLSSFGKTSEEIFTENLHSITHNMQRAKEAGVDYYAVASPVSGSTYVPQSSPTVPTKPAEKDDDGLVND